MKLIELSALTKKVTKENAPAILLGVSLATSICGMISVATATRKADTIVQKVEKEKGEELTKKEVAKETWKCYIPTVALATTSVVCALSSNALHAKKFAAMATAYSMASSAFKEYKDKTKEVVGEAKANLIKDKVLEEKVKESDVDQIEDTGNGDTLFYEPYTGRYFRSDVNSVKRAFVKASSDILMHDYVTLNDLFDYLGLHNTKLGDMVIWDFSSMSDANLEVRFSGQVTEKEEPCLALDYSEEPVPSIR